MQPVMKQVSFAKQQGALMLVTLLILLIVSILGMSSIDSTGLEMQMSSNSRAQQQAFEAAEYTLSWVENSVKENGYFTTISLANTSPACGNVCFESTCTKGYCFNGTNPTSAGCKVNTPATEPHESAALWSNANLYKTLAVPNTTIVAKYIIEYRCYTSRDPALPYVYGSNSVRMFRITAFTTAEGGRARVMLRSTIKEV